MFSVYSDALVQVPESIVYITYIEVKFINYTMLVNDRRFLPFTHNLTANFDCLTIQRREHEGAFFLNEIK